MNKITEIIIGDRSTLPADMDDVLGWFPPYHVWKRCYCFPRQKEIACGLMWSVEGASGGFPSNGARTLEDLLPRTIKPPTHWMPMPRQPFEIKWTPVQKAIGDMMTVQEWEDGCKSGFVRPEDLVWGYWATEDKVSNICGLKPKPAWATHVCYKTK